MISVASARTNFVFVRYLSAKSSTTFSSRSHASLFSLTSKTTTGISCDEDVTSVVHSALSMRRTPPKVFFACSSLFDFDFKIISEIRFSRYDAMNAKSSSSSSSSSMLSSSFTSSSFPSFLSFPASSSLVFFSTRGNHNVLLLFRSSFVFFFFVKGFQFPNFRCMSPHSVVATSSVILASPSSSRSPLAPPKSFRSFSEDCALLLRASRKRKKVTRKKRGTIYW